MTAVGIHAHPSKKLGALPPVPHRMAMAIPFGEHIITVPKHPIAVDDVKGITFGMDLNDTVSDCVVAGRDHARQVWTSLLTGSMKVMTTAEIIADYRTQNPRFNPKLPEGDPRQQDNGMVIEQYLALLRHRGDILGYALVDQTDEEMVKAATYLGLALVGGFSMQVAQQSQTVMDYAPGSPSWGGHCMVYGSYRSKPDRLGLVTWGEVVQSTPRFLAKVCTELWFVLTKDHMAHPGFRAGFNADSFGRAVAAITGQPFLAA